MPPPAATNHRRNPRRRARKAPAFHVSVFHCMAEPVEAWERDWAELPADAISCVLRKLSLQERLLGGVAGMCRSWRRAAREEPELWRSIYLQYLSAIPPFTREATLENLMRGALRLSAGQCHTFWGEHLDDNLFMLLAKQAPLKCLDLRCSRISRGAFANAIKKLSLLEGLGLYHCLHDEQVLELVAEACPSLKRFRLVQQRCCYRLKKHTDDRKAFAIAKMHGLRSLMLVHDNLSNKGLTTIIDNCPHLKYLHIQDCCNISMDANLTDKCAQITMHYYEYLPSSKPCSCCFFPSIYAFQDDGYVPYDDHELDDYHDLSLYSYLGDEIDGTDFEEHERILDVKSMRRYLS